MGVLLIVIAAIVLLAIWLCKQRLTAYFRLSVNGDGVNLSVKSTLGPFALPELGFRLWWKGEPRAHVQFGSRYFAYATKEIVQNVQQIASSGRAGKLRKSPALRLLVSGIEWEVVRLNLRAGIGEAASTAMFAGFCWFALSPLIAFCCGKGLRPEVSVIPDFRKPCLILTARCMISTTFGHVIRAGAFYARQALREATLTWITRLKISCVQRWKASRI